MSLLQLTVDAAKTIPSSFRFTLSTASLALLIPFLNSQTYQP
jgi:hypothetical protein